VAAHGTVRHRLLRRRPERAPCCALPTCAQHPGLGAHVGARVVVRCPRLGPQVGQDASSPPGARVGGRAPPCGKSGCDARPTGVVQLSRYAR